MRNSRAIVPVLLLLFIPGPAPAQHAPTLQGVWEMVSQRIDGKDNAISGREIKLVTGTHFAWVSQDKKNALGLLAKKTERDSLMAFIGGFGAGTYKIDGKTYTETLEFFYDPLYVGHSIRFTYKLEGNRWLVSGSFPVLEGDKKVREFLLEEVWKRVE
jgi:hypothetical protein